MVGLGTIVNAFAIIAGGLIGTLFGKLIKDRYQETILRTMGFAVIVMALGSVMTRMLYVTVTTEPDGIAASLDTRGIVMMIVSLAAGAFLGELLNLDLLFEKFGLWLRKKTGNEGDNRFIDAFVTASLTVCVGAMAIIGSITDGISGDHSILFAKALLDLILVMMMSASMGKGCAFSAVPVAVLQGTVTLLANVIAPWVTEVVISNISYVGNVLILCVGVNLVWPKTIRVANLLPELAVAVVFACF